MTKEQKLKPLTDYNKDYPLQLDLFQHATAEDPRFSNLVMLYDAIPKYVWGVPSRIEGRFLDAIERPFVFQGKHYLVRITPALIKDPDGNRNYFPSSREEIIEDSLRLLACSGNGIFLDDAASVIFTLRELQRELQRTGHTYSIPEIKEALWVCKLTGIELRTMDGQEIMLSSLFETVGIKGLADYREDSNAKAFVRFNSMVTKAIQSGHFRHFNYQKGMSIKSVIARQLFKRLSAVFTQASITNSYTLNLDTIIRDFGLTRHSQLRTNLRNVLKALKELVEKDVLLRYEVVKMTSPDRSNKIENAKFTLWPSLKFSYEMRVGNNRMAVIQNALSTGDTSKIKTPKTQQLL